MNTHEITPSIKRRGFLASSCFFHQMLIGHLSDNVCCGNFHFELRVMNLTKHTLQLFLLQVKYSVMFQYPCAEKVPNKNPKVVFGFLVYQPEWGLRGVLTSTTMRILDWIPSGDLSGLSTVTTSTRSEFRVLMVTLPDTPLRFSSSRILLRTSNMSMLTSSRLLFLISIYHSR